MQTEPIRSQPRGMNRGSVRSLSVINDDNDKVRARAKELASAVDHSYLRLAKMLQVIESRELYQYWGFDSFKEYIRDELAIHPAKARALCRFWERIRSLDIDRNALMDIGFTKATALSRVVTEKNFDELLAMAKQSNVADFLAYVQTLLGNVPSGPRAYNLKFAINNSNTKLFLEALEVAKEIFHTDNDSEAAARMAGHWLAEYGQANYVKAPPEDFCALLNDIYDGGTFTFTKNIEPKNAESNK